MDTSAGAVGAKCKKEGKLSDNSVSINVVGGTNATLENNVSGALTVPCERKKYPGLLYSRSFPKVTGHPSITFNGRDGSDSLCVWWNGDDSRWEASGCETIVDSASGTVSCDCSHLTTFAVIENVNKNCGALKHAFGDNTAWDTSWQCSKVQVARSIFEKLKFSRAGGVHLTRQ